MKKFTKKYRRQAMVIEKASKKTKRLLCWLESLDD